MDIRKLFRRNHKNKQFDYKGVSDYDDAPIYDSLFKYDCRCNNINLDIPKDVNSDNAYKSVSLTPLDDMYKNKGPAP